MAQGSVRTHTAAESDVNGTIEKMFDTQVHSIQAGWADIVDYEYRSVLRENSMHRSLGLFVWKELPVRRGRARVRLLQELPDLVPSFRAASGQTFHHAVEDHVGGEGRVQFVIGFGRCGEEERGP